MSEQALGERKEAMREQALGGQKGVAEEQTLLQQRAQMYRFLSRLYLTEVDELLLDALEQMEFPQTCPDSEMAEGYEQIASYIKREKEQMEAAKASPDGVKLQRQEILDDLAVDYARVFLSAGVASGKAAFPFESVYTSRQHLMMQESRNEVIALYAQKGIAPGKEMYRVPEDHLGLLLEYMALLCQEEAAGERTAAAKTPKEQQREFLSQHLKNWVFAFTADLLKYASTDFYRGLAKLTRGFLTMEQGLLEIK